MELINTIYEMKQWSKERQNNSIAFVPTMGFLHIGHVTLLEHAKKIADKSVLSIYVNPSQFRPGEDLDKYPRDMEGDLKKAKNSGTDCVFIPDSNEIYPENYQTWIEVMELQKGLCGDSRPGHFKGVATIVCKLFNIVRPDFAIFGEKDFQQLAIIRQMVADLNMDIKIIGHPTIREENGLAFSSRNAYLTEKQRFDIAPNIYKTLQQALNIIKNGEKQAVNVENFIIKGLSVFKEFKIDYIFIGNKFTLKKTDIIDNNTIIAIAVWLGNTRLIDNAQLCSE